MKLITIKMEWGLGIGDWGLGIGDWAQSPIPNPQSPIPIHSSSNNKKKNYFSANYYLSIQKMSSYYISDYASFTLPRFDIIFKSQTKVIHLEDYYMKWVALFFFLSGV